MCPSSAELIVSIRHLVYVTVYRWPFGVQVWMRLISSKPAHQTVIYTQWHIPDVLLIQLILLMMGIWLALKHVENRNKHTCKRIVRQVGYLQIGVFYRDARSTEHELLILSARSLYKIYFLRTAQLTHWGRGHLNCLNARSRGF